MRITFNPTTQYSRRQPNFTSNNCFYLSEQQTPVGTVSRMFREDLLWHKLALHEHATFYNTPKVQTLQFACSDGSESYTQAIALMETDSIKGYEKFLPIQAMDINDNILDVAKSGLVNFSKDDIWRMRNMGFDIDKYFEKADNQIIHKNLQPVTVNDVDFKTYKIKPILSDKITFKKANMFDVMKNHKDESNTIVLCRNVLGYYPENKIDEFIDLLGKKLKSNSLVVIGSMEVSEKVDIKLLYKDFVQVAENIFRKVR